MSLDIGDLLKLFSLLVVFTAAIFAATKETVAATDSARRSRQLVLGFAAAGLLLGAGTQVYDSYKGYLASEKERIHREAVVTRLENVAASLALNTNVHRISIVCFFNDQVTEDRLRQPGAFRLISSFQVGNRLALTVRARSDESGGSEVGEIDIDSGAFARARLLLSDTATTSRPFLGSTGTSFWIYLWPDQVIDRAYQERSLWLKRKMQSSYPQHIGWPFRQVGDFVGNPIAFSAEGLLAKHLQKIVLRVNDDLIAEFAVTDARASARDVYAVFNRVAVR